MTNLKEEREAIVEQYAQSIQDTYFITGAKVSIETWNNTKDILRNALLSYEEKVMARVREEEHKKTVAWSETAYKRGFEDGKLWNTTS